MDIVNGRTYCPTDKATTICPPFGEHKKDIDRKKRIKGNAVPLLSAPCRRKSELNMKIWKKSLPNFKINNEIQTLKKMI